MRDAKGEVGGIVEDRDATGPQSEIKEVNAGIYVVSPQFLFSALDGLSNCNQQGEYYLPDIVGIASRKRGERRHGSGGRVTGDVGY